MNTILENDHQKFRNKTLSFVGEILVLLEYVLVIFLSHELVDGQVTIIFVVSVCCLSVCLCRVFLSRL